MKLDRECLYTWDPQSHQLISVHETESFAATYEVAIANEERKVKSEFSSTQDVVLERIKSESAGAKGAGKGGPAAPPTKDSKPR